MSKNDWNTLLAAKDWDGIGAILDERPGAVRHLVSRLTLPDGELLDTTLMSFQVVAKVFDKERTLDLLRRLMWMLNEESGNNCPNAALAIAHIAQVHPDWVAPHVPSLKVHADDPGELMSKTVRKALTIINRASKKK